MMPNDFNGSFFIREDAYLQNYKVLMEICRKEISGEAISGMEKQEAVSTLINGIACREDVIKYKRRMRVNPDTDNMYPDYYIPPYNGNKKLRLIQGYLPKTHILYANHYELEILRLLFLFAPGNEKITEMVNNTLHRLKNTCFGNSCTQGECMATGISVLRFLAVAQPNDMEWSDKLINPLRDRFISCGNGRPTVQNGSLRSYFLMAYRDITGEKIKSLSDMTLEELWQLFPIILTEHDSRWGVWYEEEKRKISDILHDKKVRINHIGSTAINNIMAKPIVDILVEIPQDISMWDIKEKLVNGGYICMSEEKDRKSFNRGYTEKGFAERVFHVHLRYYGDNDELYFRDYMNNNPGPAKEYEQLKLSLWKKYEHNRDAYTGAKTEFIEKYTRRAKIEYGSRY